MAAMKMWSSQVKMRIKPSVLTIAKDNSLLLYAAPLTLIRVRVVK